MRSVYAVVAVFSLLSGGQSAPVDTCESLTQQLEIQAQDQVRPPSSSLLYIYIFFLFFFFCWIWFHMRWGCLCSSWASGSPSQKAPMSPNPSWWQRCSWTAAGWKSQPPMKATPLNFIRFRKGNSPLEWFSAYRQLFIVSQIVLRFIYAFPRVWVQLFFFVFFNSHSFWKKVWASASLLNTTWPWKTVLCPLVSCTIEPWVNMSKPTILDCVLYYNSACLQLWPCVLFLTSPPEKPFRGSEVLLKTSCPDCLISHATYSTGKKTYHGLQLLSKTSKCKKSSECQHLNVSFLSEFSPLHTVQE